jgi:hypothetical protein
MAFAPQLHPAHGLRSPEVIAVAVFTQPPVLAGCLACLLATRLGTIPLSVGGPRIRNKKLAATAAFTPGLRAAHGEPNLRRIRRRRKQKRRSPRKSRPKKEEQILDRSDRRKRLGRKWIFKPPAFPSFIPPLTAAVRPRFNRRDTRFYGPVIRAPACRGDPKGPEAP